MVNYFKIFRLQVESKQEKDKASKQKYIFYLKKEERLSSKKKNWDMCIQHNQF